MRFRLSLLLAFAALVVASVALPSYSAAEGEATDLTVDGQTCTDGFKVQVDLSWTPSGAGTQWVDISLQNDGFSSPYLHGGPFNASRSAASINNLEPQRNYYARVSTWDGSEWQRSALFAFTTECLPYEATAPIHLAGASVSDTAVAFSWQAGNGNLWYCLDYARSAEELLSQTGTWRNSGCGMTDTTHTVEGLTCGRTYYARVWAWTTQGGRHSSQVIVSTRPCATTITEATNLRTLFAASDIARIAWDRGNDNIWYCVDVALSLQDLLGFGDTWENHCRFTDTELELTGLKCETQYVWRVYTWNFHVNAHSLPNSFETEECGLTEQDAPVESVEVHRSDDGQWRADVVIVLPDGCHRPGNYRISYNGNRIVLRIENLVEEPISVCSLSRQTYEWSINLGSDFNPGTTYEVDANRQVSTFFTPTS